MKTLNKDRLRRGQKNDTVQNLPTAAARSKSSQKKKSDGGKRRKDPAVSTAGKDVEIKPCVFPEDHLFPTADVKKWEAKKLQVWLHYNKVTWIVVQLELVVLLRQVV
ncbi:hypothetical protein CYMTET_55426 [Cymbomonas tetramitiformis]|uniref:Uncharacterized protein n=1 Tax=Cymbomonas tetramitiformis TaxID=36881 RepID=A0AAE0EPS3_9CHLO|nr:hypothetical protein CYMTET_55426 [Cymbomonas tetramitiformis]